MLPRGAARAVARARRDYVQVVSLQVRMTFGAGAEVDACVTVATFEEPIS
jgi:hypothetical protein